MSAELAPADMLLLAVNAAQVDSEPVSVLAAMRIVSALATVAAATVDPFDIDPTEVELAGLVTFTAGGLTLTPAGLDRVTAVMLAA
jgi:hypothetical protein